LLKEIFPRYSFQEQFRIEDNLSLDFYCPKLSLAFEFQGTQHDEFNPYFQKSNRDLIKQKQRDRKKKNWCELNNIVLIEIREHELDKNILLDKINWALKNK